jgi:hypothetical protein
VGGGGVNWTEKGNFQNSTAPHTSSNHHCWRILLVATGRAGVHWPIYRSILLVPAVLTQPILLIIGVGCIKIADTKNIDLWCWPHKDDRH